MADRQGQYILDTDYGKLCVTFFAENHLAVATLWDEPVVVNRVPLRLDAEYVLIDGEWQTGKIDERTGEPRQQYGFHLRRADWTTRPGMSDVASHSAYDKLKVLVQECIAYVLKAHPDAPKLGKLASLQDAKARLIKSMTEKQAELAKMEQERISLANSIYTLGQELSA